MPKMAGRSNNTGVFWLDRLKKLRKQLLEQGLDGILILEPDNRRYLSGFSGSSGALLITSSEALLFTDFRYMEQAAAQAPSFRVIKHGQVIWDDLAGYARGLANLAFEQNFVTYEQFRLLQEKFTESRLVPVAGFVENLRSIKEDVELAEIRRACELADRAFSHILTWLEPGMTELEIALELEFFMRRNGASASAFEFIVASGPRSSLPHGVASGRRAARGDILTMDFGCVVNGYCSDITRTVVIGEASDKQREIYRVVLEAQMAALSALRAGMSGQEVDKVAREIISRSGYGENFGHGLGHSVGLAVHEEPRLSPAGLRVLEPGMVVTVEPGIYLPDWGGVRIEDMVVVTENGCSLLTKSPKELIIL